MSIRQWITVVFPLIVGLCGCSIGTSDSATPTSKAQRPGLQSVPLKSHQSDSVRAGTMRFSALAPDATHVDFVNRLDLSHPDKRLYFSAYACGGVAVGDVDGDQRPDLFLASGPDRNRLFRQNVPLQFVDVTAESGIDGGQRWGAGAAMSDIDNDGDLDIYLCNYDSPNQLYLNNGHGQFQDVARELGLNLNDACLMPAFCDFDRDGDLDVYVLTHRYYRRGGRPAKPPVAMRNGRPYVLPEFEKFYALTHRGDNNYELDNTGRRDYLMRQNSDGTFSDISHALGIGSPGHGLSVTWWDFNDDHWPDIYVGNDFNDPDHLYRNNGDGTFTDVLASSIPHTSWFSMGADFADLTGDGRFDLLVADMSSRTHYGQKTTMGAMNATKLALVAGPPPQIMKNALFVNTGIGRFLEAAELAGLADTDWTWAVKLADMDNDGRVDVFLTNGVSRDNNHSDYQQNDSARIGRTEWELYEDRPTRPERNLAFRNEGDLSFRDVSHQWGFVEPTMSYATAYADLDRDGDLDLVTAHLDAPVGIYRNDRSNGNGLLVALRGTTSNRAGLGTIVSIESANRSQIRMLSPQTGFLSSNEPILHFGLGTDRLVDRMTIHWPSGQIQTFDQIAANQLVTIVEAPPDKTGSDDAALALEISANKPKSAWYGPLELGTSIVHRETEHNDFDQQPLLPNKLSQLGPGLAVADYDGDGDDDFFMGGARGFAGQLLVNDGQGRFHRRPQAAFDNDRICEDLGALWFDADGDGDMDLYVASGGVEAEAQDDALRNRLYLNDGHGNLSASTARVPDLRDSSGTVAGADFDRDGDLDLFVGSRVIPSAYPQSPPSRLLENRHGHFVDVTDDLAPGLTSAGLVTGAVWSDADQDGWVDLLLTTEWGPVRLFGNLQGKLVERTDEAQLKQWTGWWNGIAARDVDGDGDMDYVVTNFGLNTKYHVSRERPVQLYYGDFDDSGVKRLVEAEYEAATLFPVRGKSCSTHAMPHLAQKFDTFHDFASASLADIYSSECLQQSDRFAINTLQSGLLLNDGAASFKFLELPRIAQVSPAFGVVLTEVNGDGRPDIYLVQNFFHAQPETGRMDGGLSQLLLGNGDGTFRPVPVTTSGLVVPGDATAVVICDLNGNRRNDFLVATNDGEILAFAKQSPPDRPPRSGAIYRVALVGLPGNPHAVGARVTLHSQLGQQTAEVHAGSGYLSQSTHALSFGIAAQDKVDHVQVRWPDGTRTVHPGNATGHHTIAQ